MELVLYTLLGKGYPLKDVIDAASRVGFDAVDIRLHEDGCHITSSIKEAEIKEIKKLVSDKGLKISGITTYYRVGLCDKNAWLTSYDGIKRAIEILNMFGGQFLRISSTDLDFEKGYEEQRRYFREQVLMVSEYAKKTNSVATIEQHFGLITSSAGEIVDLMRDIDTKNMGIVYDPGNTLMEGYERPDIQIEMLKNLIKNVHIKNGSVKGMQPNNKFYIVEWTKIDKGNLDWKLIIEKLKNIGYKGYLTLEDFAEFGSLEEKLTYDLNYLKSLL
ncbi:MAG: sugar phosphate isomerase/epimerase [bacterium]|nr:sugar phosphate isomerase/epimerase [bacterium]